MLDIFGKIDNVIREIDEQVEQVKASKEFTREGKSKRVGVLRNIKKIKAHEFVVDLRREAVRSAYRYVKANEFYKRHKQEQNEKLDYGRLNYEAEAVKSLLKEIGDDPDRAMLELEKVKLSGDVYKLKVLAELLPANVPSATKLPEFWRDVVDAARAAQSEIVNPDVARYKNETNEKIAELARIERYAAKMGDILEDNASSVYVRTNVLKRVLQGIKYDRNLGELVVDFEGLVWRKDDAEMVFDELEKSYQERATRQKEIYDSFYESPVDDRYNLVPHEEVEPYDDLLIGVPEPSEEPDLEA